MNDFYLSAVMEGISLRSEYSAAIQ